MTNPASRDCVRAARHRRLVVFRVRAAPDARRHFALRVIARPATRPAPAHAAGINVAGGGRSRLPAPPRCPLLQTRAAPDHAIGITVRPECRTAHLLRRAAFARSTPAFGRGSNDRSAVGFGDRNTS